MLESSHWYVAYDSARASPYFSEVTPGSEIVNIIPLNPQQPYRNIPYGGLNAVL